MFSKNILRWSSRSRYGTMMATRCREVHSVGWNLPPGARYVKSFSNSSIESGTSFVTVLTVPCNPGGIMGHKGNFGSAWNGGTIVPLLPSDIIWLASPAGIPLVQFRSSIGTLSTAWTHCLVGPSMESPPMTSSVPFLLALSSPSRLLRRSDKLSRIGRLAPTLWCPSGPSRSPQSSVNSDIRLKKQKYS